MNNPAQQIEIFRDFAKQELKNYIRELKTRYQNRELTSNDVGIKSFSKHLQIFEKKLLAKIKELVTEDNRFLQPALTELKDRFVEKLKLNFR